MANEELTIAKEKARLTVIGNSYPDTLTDSGLGFDIPELIVDALDELGIELPDWGPIVPPDLIIGIDPDTEIITLEYPDPEWEEPEWPDPDISDHDWPEPDWPDNDLPDIISYPMPDLDWDDFIDNLEDLGIDPNILTDLSFTGLDDLGIPTLVSLDEDFNIQMDELPASIEIVTPPNKLEYQDGERIDLTGMVVTAKKADGSTWTSVKYPNGHIPLGELIVEPTHADMDQATADSYSSDLDTSPVPNPVPVSMYFETGYFDPDFDYRYIGEISGMGGFFTAGTRSSKYLIASETSGESSVYYHHGFGPGYDAFEYRWYSNEMAYTYDGKTVYYRYGGTTASGPDGWPAGPIISGEITNPGAVAWTMIYGEIAGGGQEISILWVRPGDGKALQASFTIEVKASSGGGGGR